MKRQIIVIAILALLALGIGYGISKWMDRDIVKEEEVNLSPEERAVLETEFEDIKKQIKDLAKDADPVQRYELYTRQAEILMRLGRYKDAENSVKKVLETSREEYGMWFLLGQIQEKMHKYNDAYVSYRNAVGVEPSNIEAWRSLFALISSGNIVEVNIMETEKLYNAAFFGTGFHIDIIVSYAKFLERKGDLQGALNYWRQTLAKDPGNTDYQKEINRLEGQLGQ